MLTTNLFPKTFHWVYSGIPDNKRPKLIEKNRKHYYQTPSGKIYPSITTMLHSLMPKGNRLSLQRWREIVGREVAEYITSESAKNGTATHKIIEKYLNNQNTKKHNPNTPPFPLISKAHLEQIKPFLHNIDDIRCTEIPLYSDELRLAGTCDCIAEYNNKLSIIDFKTSRKQKKSLGLRIIFYRQLHTLRCMTI